jgi:undecaprenyl diphosphate synthase
MDGNGRWANQRGRPRTTGHFAGAKAVRTIVEHARRAGIPVLTLYVFLGQLASSGESAR